jgi:hypothetical protein
LAGRQIRFCQIGGVGDRNRGYWYGDNIHLVLMRTARTGLSASKMCQRETSNADIYISNGDSDPNLLFGSLSGL